MFILEDEKYMYQLAENKGFEVEKVDGLYFFSKNDKVMFTASGWATGIKFLREWMDLY
jgi:hypothetical protein